MSRLMLINAGDDESRVAIVDRGVLQDLHVESIQAGRTRGNIYKGTIVRVEPAIQSCFVDFGADRNGFLSCGDIARRWWKKGAPADKKRPHIEEIVTPGMHLMVQSTKEPEGRKGAALTTRVSLPGRYLVFMPDEVGAGGVSRKVEDAAERQRLKDLMTQFCAGRECSLIVRSVAAGRTKAELERDMGYLERLWKTILDDFKSVGRQGLVFSEQDVVVRCIRDYFGTDVERVLIDEPLAYKRALEYVRAAMPRHRKKFELYSDDVPLLLRHGVESQIEEIYRKRVRLPSGGEIVIDPTEALVSIDVNSGKSMSGKSMEDTALNTNIEAAAEVARQLRLRDLGGLIVIDFIDLREGKNRLKVERALKAALKDDKARHNIGRIGQFGLLELSRQRLQGTIVSASHEPCPACRGAGVVRSASSGAAGAIRRIRSLLADKTVSHVEAALPRAAAMYLLNDRRAVLAELEASTGAGISVVPTDRPADEQGSFTPQRGERAAVQTDGADDEALAAELAAAEAAAEAAAAELDAAEAEDATEAEAEAEAEPEGDAGADRAAGDDGPGEGEASRDDDDGTRRRRRRRRRRKSGGAAEAPAAARPAAAAEQAPEVGAAANSDEAVSGDRPKRRRRRRGGRGRTRRPGDGAVVDGDGAATGAAPETASTQAAPASAGRTPAEPAPPAPSPATPPAEPTSSP